MAGRKSIYRRLTGRRRGFFSYSQLWLAPDHILLVKSTRFAENYQRYSLADIHAIVVTELSDRVAAQIWIAAAAILWALAALAVSGTFAKGFFLITGVVAMATVVTDILRGPRCRCHLHTAVSRELLAPVDRMKTARAFLGHIRPAIEAVQGKLEHTPAEPSPPGMGDSPPEVSRSPGYLPEVLFVLFLVDAALVLANLHFPRSPIGNALPTTFFAEIVLVIVALIRRAGRDSRRVIYALMLATLVCIGWDAINLSRSFIALAVEASRRTNPEPVMVSWEPLAHGEAVFAAAWRIAAGVIGLVSAYLSRTA
jgi:hypothetical protein